MVSYYSSARVSAWFVLALGIAASFLLADWTWLSRAGCLLVAMAIFFFHTLNLIANNLAEIAVDFFKMLDGQREPKDDYEKLVSGQREPENDVERKMVEATRAMKPSSMPTAADGTPIGLPPEVERHLNFIWKMKAAVQRFEFNAAILGTLLWGFGDLPNLAYQ